jgi:hypothetical protein
MDHAHYALDLFCFSSFFKAKAFAPRDIKFKADVNKNHDKKYANVIISWKIPFLNLTNSEGNKN